MMSGVHDRSRRRAVTLAAFAVLFVPFLSRAQLYAPVAIGTINPITDEFGTNLHGDACMPPSQCDLVQVLWATNGIDPPDYNGHPSANNPPVENSTSYVGRLTAPGLVEPGLFATTLHEPRPPNNSKIFVRVFNAPTESESSFYADSQQLTVRDNNILYVNTTATTNAIDPRDIDNDGLNNSWEKSLGSDPADPDSDDDNMIDGDERRAGTDMLDANSVFVTVHIHADEYGNAAVAWDSVVGKKYQVERMDGPWADPVCYTNVSAVITAASEATITTITNGLSGGTGKYRVRLVE